MGQGPIARPARAVQSRDRGYCGGQKGLLTGSDGKLVDLGGGTGADGAEGSSERGNEAGSTGAGGALGGVTGGMPGGLTGGVTDDLKKKACDTILSQARSFL